MSWTARRRAVSAWATQAGAYLDPIADKCLLSGVFLALAAARMVPWWLVGIIFGRDLYILLGVGNRAVDHIRSAISRPASGGRPRLSCRS